MGKQVGKKFSIRKKLKQYFTRNNSEFYLAEVVALITFSIVFGIIVGCVLTYNNRYDKSIESANKTDELISTYNLILNNYYDNITEDELINSAIEGMVNSLDDPYSSFFDKDDTIEFNQLVDGSYVGIGVTVSNRENHNYIVDIAEGSSADKIGLKVGDIFYQIGDEVVDGYDLDSLSNLIKGNLGDKLDVIVLRNEEKIHFTLYYSKVDIKVIEEQILEHNNLNIGYISISSFSANSYEQFKKAFKSLEKEGIKSLIIDVRNNPGGHLLQVQKILSLFFDKDTILYQIESREGVNKIYSSGTKNKNYNIVVLIDYNSASAAEILASCFKDNYKNSFIVGTKSYGKGTVQSELKLSTGSSLKYTVQKWLTSKGKWIDGVGVEPDISISQSDEISAQGKDLQLQEAINILEKES